MEHQSARRLTDEEHGTLNVALKLYADEVDDPTEAKAVRNLADAIISCEVHIYSVAHESRISGSSPKEQYTYGVHWSPETQEHVGTVAEFPSMSWLDSDPRAALDGIQNLVAEVLAEMSQAREEPPHPQ